jgi:hypothetical protein
MEEPLEAAALGVALVEAVAFWVALVEAVVVGALDFAVADGLVVVLELELQAARIALNNAMVITVPITHRAVRSAHSRSLNGVIDSSVRRCPQRFPQ